MLQKERIIRKRLSIEVKIITELSCLLSIALQDTGLPENNIPLALLLFNAGVEAGQLIFVFVILLLMAGTRQLKFRFPEWILKAPAYLIGTLAMYWFMERLALIF